MTTQELMTLTRLAIRHQDFRLRCLIRDQEKKSKQAMIKSIADIEHKASRAIETAKQFESNEETEIQELLASFLHYATSYTEKLAQLKEILKTKNDQLTLREKARQEKLAAKEAEKLARKEQKIEKMKGEIENTRKKLESMNQTIQNFEAEKPAPKKTAKRA